MLCVLLSPPKQGPYFGSLPSCSPVCSMDLAEGVPFPLSVSAFMPVRACARACACDVCQGPGLQQYSGSSHSGLESLSVKLGTS